MKTSGTQRTAWKAAFERYRKDNKALPGDTLCLVSFADQLMDDLAEMDAKMNARYWESVRQENVRLRKIAAAVPAKVWIKAKEDAGFGEAVRAI